MTMEDDNNCNNHGNTTVIITDTSKEDGHAETELEPLARPDNDRSHAVNEQMALYEEDFTQKGKLSAILSSFTGHQSDMSGDSSVVIEEPEAPQHKSAQLGTMLGVYMPCIQNIFGVILFIRHAWVVGMAGLGEGFAIILICCCTTMLTAISMSAIATNGVVPAGGSYFMISRALGAEFGGAVGILFYLGTSVASSMYIIGAVEILVTYIAPAISIFGDITIEANAFNNFRVYGTCLLILMIICVIIGVRFVSKFAPISLACVILSILCIYIGIFVSNPERSIKVCMLGDRLLTSRSITEDGEILCTKNDTGPIFRNYCGANGSFSDCDPYFQDENNEARLVPGIPGIASGVFKDNIANMYTKRNNIPGTETPSTRKYGEIAADVTTSFTILLAIFFPSVTGIMAGSNRSGDLADAQKSIPIGTICAIGTTSFVYLSCVLFFGATIIAPLMNDKFGESIGGGLVVAHLAWPHFWVILIGSFLSTVGAGLQSLTGAPRLLQAIAQDGVIPFLALFKVQTRHGEPLRAIILTAFISEIGILIASLDSVAPIITMFFLMCYGFVNMACALQTLLRTPNWRPRFRFYHWLLSLLGMALCIALMFISSWYYAIIAIVIAVCIYKYIEYKGAEKEWGDGIRGLAMSAARYALWKLEEGPPHTKNWRPQLLVLLKLDENLQPRYSKMLSFARQLKAGKGLTLIGSVLEGAYSERLNDVTTAKANIKDQIEKNSVKGFVYISPICVSTNIKDQIEKNSVKGFADVAVTNNVADGLSQFVQSAGLGGMCHNTVVLSWPLHPTEPQDPSVSRSAFLSTVKSVCDAKLCLLVLKGVNEFPDNSERLHGTIDVWWVVHEGGLLMLLPFLLRQHKAWRNCKLRIFTVAQLEDNSIKIKKDLERYLYQLRIPAEIAVIEMSDSDISAYTYERTLVMVERTQLLKDMRINKAREPQAIIDDAHVPSAGVSKSSSTVRFKLEVVPEVGIGDATSDGGSEQIAIPSQSERNQFTFNPRSQQLTVSSRPDPIKPSEVNVRRMHTAVRLNEVIKARSSEAQLVIINMPMPPATHTGSLNYIEYLEVLTEGLHRVLLVRGSGREVITIFS